MTKKVAELSALIMQEHSLKHMEFIAEILQQKPDIIPQLLLIVYKEEHPISNRAAWPLRKLFDKKPALLEPYYDEIIAALPTIKSSSILRTLLSIICRTTIDEKWHAFFLQYTSELIINNSTEIAVKAGAMDIFFQIAKKHRELFAELEQMMAYIYPDASRGIQNKCRNFTKSIQKLSV
ncbi:MAG: hypothetical protein B7C24_11225 [Bacteroidetes bacterium 4572_77]|nr:MAG: hypothetical protein B7C24_11225 [Bacteroidetes bacterium 4572_77]